MRFGSKWYFGWGIANFLVCALVPWDTISWLNLVAMVWCGVMGFRKLEEEKGNVS